MFPSALITARAAQQRKLSAALHSRRAPRVCLFSAIREGRKGFLKRCSEGCSELMAESLAAAALAMAGHGLASSPWRPQPRIKSSVSR